MQNLHKFYVGESQSLKLQCLIFHSLTVSMQANILWCQKTVIYFCLGLLCLNVSYQNKLKIKKQQMRTKILCFIWVASSGIKWPMFCFLRNLFHCKTSLQYRNIYVLLIFISIQINHLLFQGTYYIYNKGIKWWMD